MIVEAYGGQLFAIILFVISILLFSTIANIRIKNNLKIQNKRYEILSEISNEYLYEYNGRYDHLQLSDKCIQLFGTGEVYNSVIKKLKNILLNNLQDDKILTVELPLIDGGIGVFKLINSSIYNNENKLDSIIGKLVDISEEFAERRRLITKSQIDGLTGLYNSVTSRKLITETIRNKDENKLDAFILLDCDNFKSINDNLGHLTGDEILIHIARSLEQVFRASDIIGRVGGDEFCVYMKEIPYPQFVKEKGQQLNDSIYERISKMKVSLSIGVELVNKVRSYEDIFVKADNALYSAKHNGGGQTVIYAIEGEDGI